MEEVHAFEATGGADEFGIFPKRRLHARGLQLLVREKFNRLDPRGDILPEGLNIGSAGDTAGQADDGDLQAARIGGGVRRHRFTPSPVWRRLVFSAEIGRESWEGKRVDLG